jgi:hypothetical protein
METKSLPTHWVTFVSNALSLLDGKYSIRGVHDDDGDDDGDEIHIVHDQIQQIEVLMNIITKKFRIIME